VREEPAVVHAHDRLKHDAQVVRIDELAESLKRRIDVPGRWSV
jgi:hypothetical protein